MTYSLNDILDDVITSPMDEVIMMSLGLCIYGRD